MKYLLAAFLAFVSTFAFAQKYNPGHYIAIPISDNHRATVLETVFAKPGVRGLHARVSWREMEPSRGKYNFDTLRSILTHAEAADKQVVLMIVDKSFRAGDNPLPDYIKSTCLPNRPGGCTAMRWSPWVINRLNALTAAIGAEFDTHGNFEGVSFQESALGLNQNILDNNKYTADKYANALITILNNAAVNMPNSRVFWYMNFLVGGQQKILDIAKATAANGIIVGGPDVLPDNYALVNRTYPFYEEMFGQQPLFISAQYNSYNHQHTDTSRPTKYWTTDELFLFALNRLHSNYIFWTRKPFPQPGDSYSVEDAYKTIEAHDVFAPCKPVFP